MGFVGANLLGGTGEPGEDQLWLDVGGVLRNPNPQIISGGVMLRLDGTFHLATNIPMSVEFGTLGWVHQGFLLVDTAGMRLTYAGNDNLGVVIDLQDNLEPAFRQVFDDAQDRKNIVFLTHLEGWWMLNPHLEAGPVAWREDRVISLAMNQYLGLGLRSAWNLGPVSIRPAIRGGWGTGTAGWGVYGDLRIGSRI